MYRFLKCLMVVLAISIVTVGYAAQTSTAVKGNEKTFADYQHLNGFYLGGQIMFTQHIPPVGTADKVASSNYGTGVVAGYVFPSHIGLEAGFTYYGSTVTSSGHDVCSLNNFSYACPDHYYLYMGDLSAKYFYQVALPFNVYAQAGLAIVHEDMLNVTVFNIKNAAEFTQVAPLVGVGLQLFVARSLSVELGIQDVIGVGRLNNIFNIPLTLAYHF